MLGTPRLTWRRLEVFVEQAAIDPATALWRSQAGDFAEWRLQTQLAASMEHSLRVLLWRESKDAQSRPPKNYPQPVRPPSVEPEPVKPRLTLAALADFQKRMGGESRGG